MLLDELCFTDFSCIKQYDVNVIYLEEKKNLPAAFFFSLGGSLKYPSSVFFFTLSENNRHPQTLFLSIPLRLCFGRLNFGPILRLCGDLAQVKSPFRDFLHPSSIWAHAYSPPFLSFLILLHRQSNHHQSSYFHPMTPEQPIEHDCNYNQACRPTLPYPVQQQHTVVSITSPAVCVMLPIIQSGLFPFAREIFSKLLNHILLT